MKRVFIFFVVSLFVFPAFCAGRMGNSGAARVGVVATHVGATSARSNVGGVNKTGAAKVAVVDDNPDTATLVNRDKEKTACLSNNIGMNNTFVWAAKDSNTSNYASMIEDVEHPENNVCFVLVEMRSDDNRINVSDIQKQYFEWGQAITCGSWVDKDKMKKRILEAKKTARTLGTIAGAVGGAGIGVGAMEWFGNKALSNIDGLGGLQGQKQYAEYSVEWYQAKGNELKEKDKTEYDAFVADVADLKKFCENTNAQECNEDKYKNLISAF